MIAEFIRDAGAPGFAMTGSVMRSAATNRPFQLLLLVSFLYGCNREEEKGEAPPEVTAPPRDVCEAKRSAPVVGLPTRVGDYCVDPNADVRRYGAFGSTPLDDVCTELFNGECELYKSYGLEGVKTLRYVSGKGGSTTVNLVVSSFRRSTGAYGFLTRRVLGDGIPSQVTVEPLDVTGRGVAGVGTTTIWRGKDVVELTYVNEEQTPQEIEALSPKVLYPLARAISSQLVGPTEPERSVRFLENLGVDQLGVSVLIEGLLGVSGTGPGTLGFFTKAEIPHRVVIAERRDKTGAEDLLRLLRRSGPGKKLKGRDVTELRRTREGAPPETWFLRRNDDAVIAVGPLEVPSETPAQSTPEERKAEDTAWREYGVRRLMSVSGEELGFE